MKRSKVLKTLSMILNVSLLWARKNVDLKILSIVLFCIKDKVIVLWFLLYYYNLTETNKVYYYYTYNNLQLYTGMYK